MLTIRLFGSLTVCREGQPVPQVTQREGERILAYLLLHRNREIDARTLTQEIWPGQKVSDDTLTKRIGQLRQTLQLSPEALRHRNFIVQFRPEGIESDVEAFDEALERGDTEALKQAFSLYRGPLLHSKNWSEAWALTAKRDYEQKYLRVLSRLAAEALQSGDFDTAANYLDTLLTLNPAHEEAWRDRMDALTRADRRLDAQNHYKRCAAYFFEQGLDVPAPIRLLHESLKQEPSRGFPRFLTSLIGREEDLSEIKSRFAGKPLMTLTGSGGVGKTRLAVQAAREMQTAFPNHVWFVDLSLCTDPVFLMSEVASALEVREEPGRSIASALLDYLKPKSLLIVLDNCEHLLSGCRELVHTLLNACPDLCLLTTSREPLGIIGEEVYRVPSLSLPMPEATETSTALLRYAAIQLFCERASAISRTSQTESANLNAVRRICFQLDGIPLAIELAAALTEALSVEQIEARLQTRFELLRGEDPTRPKRQQTLRATIDWSYDLLSKEEQALLRSLSVFVGGWVLEAAEAMVVEATEKPHSAVLLLRQLVHKSLVVVEERAGEKRYRLLETIRQYARERLEESGESEQRQRQHLQFLIQRAEAAEQGLRSTEHALWRNRLEQEQENFRKALTWSLESPEVQGAGVRLTGALWWFWLGRGYFDEGNHWLSRALACHRIAAPTAQLKVLGGTCLFAFFQGHQQKVAREALRCLYLAVRVGDSWYKAIVFTVIGLLGEYLRLRPVSVACMKKGLALARSAEDEWLLAGWHACQGNLLWHRGQYADARTQFAHSVELYEKVGDRLFFAHSLNCLAHLTWWLQDYVRARKLCEQGLSLATELKSRRCLAGCLEEFAGVFAHTGKPASALLLLKASEALYIAMDVARMPQLRRDCRRLENELRVLLGAERYTEIAAQGLALSPEKAIEEAMAEPHFETQDIHNLPVEEKEKA